MLILRNIEKWKRKQPEGASARDAVKKRNSCRDPKCLLRMETAFAALLNAQAATRGTAGSAHWVVGRVGEAQIAPFGPVT
jgi:hypothetical protein